MSLAGLQSWLLDEGIRRELEQLTRRMVIAELDNLVPEPEDAPPAAFGWARLLLAGSILARSNRRAHHDAALRIGTAAVMLSGSDSVKDAGAVLLGKLSNFRTVALASERDLLHPDLEPRLGMALRLESQRRQMDHAILMESTGRWLQVNEFQQRFWNDAGDHDWLSASAPTASGKTFLVLQWLIDQMQSSEARVAVYLAPTRALVSEIESNLLSLLGRTAASMCHRFPCAISTMRPGRAVSGSYSCSRRSGCTCLSTSWPVQPASIC